MSDAFRESDATTFRNIVTFQSGFGVIADQPFNVGSPITVNSNLVAYNQILPIGGISGYVAYTGVNNQSIYVPSIISGQNYIMNLNNGTIVGIVGNVTNINFNSKILLNSNVNSLDWGNRQLINSNGVCLSWQVYTLNDSNEIVALDWNNKILTGNWNAQNLFISGRNLGSYLGNQQFFTTGISPTGFDTYTITYPSGAFSATPKIQLTVEVSGNNTYSVNISGRTPTGFSALFSDLIRDAGVVLHCFATIN